MKKNKKVIKTLVSFLLDRTGSMDICQEATIDGFNEYINTLKQDCGDEVYFTLTQFDNQSIDVIHDRVSILRVSKLNKKTYVPRGMTNLNDAIGGTIHWVETSIKDFPVDSVIFVIMTDGLENASKEHTKQSVAKLIEKKEKSGWKFVYLGANQDSFSEGLSRGISANGIRDFTYDNIPTTYAAMGMSTNMYRNTMNKAIVKGENPVTVAQNHSFFENPDEDKEST